MTQNMLTSRLLASAGALVLFASTAANVALIVTNRHLSEHISALQAQQLAPRGAILPQLKGLDSSGKPIVLDSGIANHPTVLFVLSSTCRPCARNWPQWQRILASQKELGWRAVFINLGSRLPADYRKSHGIDAYPVVDDVSRDSTLTYRFYFTPETIVLNSQGKVVNEWVGELSPDDVGKFPQLLANAQ
jgi:hypothetical protein